MTGRKKTQDRLDASREIARARWQLWLTTFAILGSLAVVLAFVSSGNDAALPQISFLPVTTLRLALIGLVLGFAIYALDRERNLRSLSDRLTEQRVESATLATRIEYLDQLQQERDTNAALLDGSADGIAVVGPALRLLRFNGAMRSLCGARAGQWIGAFAPSVMCFASAAGEPLEGDNHPLAVVARTGEPLTGVEMRLRLPDGEERWVSGTFSPIRDRNERRPGLVLVTARDITAQKEMEAVQRDFVSIVSHELRSPLTAIKGFSKTLLQRGDRINERTRSEFLSTIDDQADRLSRLVEDLLQVARIDAQRLRIEPELIDPAQMVDRLKAQFAIKWAGRRIEVATSEHLPILADRRSTEEVLINLIDNAVKYSDPGTPVVVRLKRCGGSVEIAIEDRGFGIAPEDAANLFQKFQRVTSPATRDIGGTGLGLYIVKALVEAHGGHVWVESAPGAGSTFGFTMPAAGVRRIEESA